MHRLLFPFKYVKISASNAHTSELATLFGTFRVGMRYTAIRNTHVLWSPLKFIGNPKFLNIKTRRADVSSISRFTVVLSQSSRIPLLQRCCLTSQYQSMYRSCSLHTRMTYCIVSRFYDAWRMNIVRFIAWIHLRRRSQRLLCQCIRVDALLS